MAFIKSCSTDFRNEHSSTCEVVHETNKLTSEISCPTDSCLGSIGKALVLRSRGPGFNIHWGQFLTNFFLLFLCKDLSDNLTENVYREKFNYLHSVVFVTEYICYFSSNLESQVLNRDTILETNNCLNCMTLCLWTFAMVACMTSMTVFCVKKFPTNDCSVK